MFSATLDLKELRQYKMYFFKKARKIVSHFNISVSKKRRGIDEHGQT